MQIGLNDQPATSEVRVDRWLWSTRLFPTRTRAALACQRGQVLIGGQRVKPSRSVRIGDRLTVVLGDLTRSLRVLALLERRVGAKQVSQYCEDLTPPEEYAQLQASKDPQYRATPEERGPKPDRRARRARLSFFGD